jgi:hypothetical protein
MLNRIIENEQKFRETTKIVLHRRALTKGSNGAIIIKLSTRETLESTKERRKLRDKRTSERVVQKTGTPRNSKKILQKYLTNE